MNLTLPTYRKLQNHVYPANTHTYISRCVESIEFDRFVFHPMDILVQTICRVISIPNICSAHRKALQMSVINGHLSFHLAENTSTNQPLCRYISVHVPKANESFNNHYATEAFMY